MNSLSPATAEEEPVLQVPPWPVYSEDEIEAARKVLASGRVNAWTGNTNAAFEDAFAELLGLPHAISLANGSVALELALEALDIGPGDEVIVPARSFVASASCVARRGARPVFADICRDSQNLVPDTIEPVLGPATRAVIVAHIDGWPADMPAIMACAAAHDLLVIEDCAQAHGARFGGTHVGSFGNAGCFSFCQDKIISTGGEGGMLVTGCEDTWKKAWAIKENGKHYEDTISGSHAPGFRWLVRGFGTNYRMTALQAAIGIRQVEKLEGWHASRHRNARIMYEALSDIACLRRPWPDEHCDHAWYRYSCFTHSGAQARDDLISAITRAGAPCFSGICPEIYRERAFVEAGCAPTARLPVARELGETCLSFLVHPTIDPDTMERYAATVRDVLLPCTV